MKKYILLLMLTALIAAPSLAQTNISGSLSGTLGPGTFVLSGDALVAYNDSLIIAPGTTIYGRTGNAIAVFGYIHIAGTETDSVVMVSETPQNWWDGLDFKPSASDNCLVEYLYIADCETHGVDFYGCSPTIRHSTIFNSSDDSSC